MSDQREISASSPAAALSQVQIVPSLLDLDIGRQAEQVSFIYGAILWRGSVEVGLACFKPRSRSDRYLYRRGLFATVCSRVRPGITLDARREG